MQTGATFGSHGSGGDSLEPVPQPRVISDAPPSAYDVGVMVISETTATVPSRYRLIEEVGQGGMAIVYRAKDDSLKREVAIKVLHRHLSAEPESKARLEREAQAVAK